MSLNHQGVFENYDCFHANTLPGQYIVEVLPAYRSRSNKFFRESSYSIARLHVASTEIYLNEFFFFELPLYCPHIQNWLTFFTITLKQV